MTDNKIKASAAVVEACEAKGINLEDIAQSKAGTVTIKDFDAHIKSIKAAKEADKAPAPEKDTPDAPAPASGDADKATKKEIVEAEPVDDEKETKLICVFKIKEDKKTFMPNSVYTGDNADYLLKKKSIKRV